MSEQQTTRTKCATNCAACDGRGWRSYGSHSGTCTDCHGEKCTPCYLGDTDNCKAK